MNWIIEPSKNNVSTRDYCVLNLCWKRDDGGACGGRLCLTRFCAEDY